MLIAEPSGVVGTEGKEQNMEVHCGKEGGREGGKLKEGVGELEVRVWRVGKESGTWRGVQDEGNNV